MKDTNANQPAFPTTVTEFSTVGIGVTVPVESEPCNGLTKLEYFAAMAMQGYVANPEVSKALDLMVFQYNIEAEIEVARHSVSYAKALLAELEKENKR